MPMLTPPSATAMGRPMASTDPNATMSTTMAKAMPISSVWGGSTVARYWPPARTSRPSIDGASSAISVADPARLGVVDVGRQVHLGERQLAGQRAGRGDLARRPRSE